MTTTELPSAMLKLIAKGAFMHSNSELLARTLIQRGESDNYIRERLLKLGFDDKAAKKLIHSSRLNTDTLSSYPVAERDSIFVLLGSIALLFFFLWLLLSGLLF
jgi:hypothetical protein